MESEDLNQTCESQGALASIINQLEQVKSSSTVAIYSTSVHGLRRETPLLTVASPEMHDICPGCHQLANDLQQLLLTKGLSD